MESEAAQGALKGLCRLQTSPRQLTWPHLPWAGVPGWLWTLNLGTNPLLHVGGRDKTPHLKLKGKKYLSLKKIWQFENLGTKDDTHPTPPH